MLNNDFNSMTKRFNIGQISISVTHLSNVLEVLTNAIKSNTPGYICVTNTRTTYIANHDPDYCKIQNNSLLTVPDGMPLVWIAHNSGFKAVGRVSGPDLMDAVFNISEQRGYSHYFYGSTPETIAEMETNLETSFPGLQIKGLVSPPFLSIEEFNIEELARELNNLKPTFFWCGLGAPKQEQFIAKLQPQLESTICVGVGLAFEYIAGSVKRASPWMQKSGLEGVYNNIQNPVRAKRFIKPFFWILIKLLKSKIQKGSNE